ncbi:alkaline phosphatase [Lampropedia puyangensis]|uniref:Alkaline phosphatase n=1 Tax=Lampropedia puyangensis TaxID=1330072 RepID=A0A4S8F6T5_9BURK|nr:alkaline phosphatase D family protein [Lampropedia puyangensis]THU02809.1 alkaline phosphatase [Lampropedia puyangensis]
MAKSSTNRRTFIIRLSSISTALAAGSVLSACGAGSEDDDASSSAVPISFRYGVASGDPLSDRVVLWTHAKYGDFDAISDDVELTWEIATDAGFTTIVSQGKTTAAASQSHTTKVDATGLRPGTSYFFRFRHGSNLSPVGQTRTLPAAGVQNVKLAVLSCSNYPAGYFHVYAEARRSGAEYALHLGDYLYEYEAGGYASQDAQALNRMVEPPHEIISLDDYRRRYAQYRTDPDLKQLHASMPMIAIWDDHEIANDAWTDGAENHNKATEGSYAQRVAAALKAYHEWMPIRLDASGVQSKIWRSFDFGNLLSLHMLETRLTARNEPVSISDLANPATAAQAQAELVSPTRQMIGQEQQAWLAQQLQNSNATWQVLGQQVLMARMEFPASILQHLNAENMDATAQQAAIAAIQAYLTAKATAAQAPQLLTPEQAALLDPSLNPKIGYNLDAWDGYPAAREAIFQTAYQLGKPLVVLAGDTHNAWHSDLILLDGTTKVGEEFATSSVSSPGFEAYLSGIDPALIQQAFLGVIDSLKFLETQKRGFLLMEFTPEAATGSWHAVDTVKSRNYQAQQLHTASMLG